VEPCPGSLSCIPKGVMPSIPVDKKKRGRPAGRAFPLNIPVRVNDEILKALDKHSAKEGLSRSELIRQIVAEHLKAKGYLK
jgi:hypothetical protein